MSLLGRPQTPFWGHFKPRRGFGVSPKIAAGSFDLPSSRLWAERASTAPSCLIPFWVLGSGETPNPLLGSGETPNPLLGLICPRKGVWGLPRTQKSVLTGFEPARAKPSGFQVHLLNHSDIKPFN